MAADRAALDDGHRGRPAIPAVRCSYGVDAALGNHHVTPTETHERYAAPEYRNDADDGTRGAGQDRP
ncbi:hypothetical protein BIV23_29560 [Streptomyces monashensis]|uniref:Uncharacterized protein n=1 Tax=Streptomyces monashensis TaxID=1678012 RepID=A0A1S2PYR4_9ACTN|nr:hypothetical protein BIV23_29560 [Streptomyces monashensis]